MARMIPDIDPAELEHASEAPVYTALRDQLDDDFTILHSYPWLRPWRGEGALLEGEIDFVVTHPDHGVLVLEVKGGEGIMFEGRRWLRRTSGAPREFKDPFNQARRNMHALLDIIKEYSGGALKRDQINHGYAVVFPHSDYEGQPPPHAARAIIISQRDLVRIDERVMAAMRAWNPHANPLDHAQHQSLLRDCLMPRFRTFRPIGPDISGAAQRLLTLTQQQASVFEGLYTNDRVLVEGIAGSGKTFLALQRALTFARAGKRALFLCFNKGLAAWLNTIVQEDPHAADALERLDIIHFHGLAASLCRRADIAFTSSRGATLDQEFWEQEASDLMEHAVLTLECEGINAQYDAIVVDEAQDFQRSWWFALTDSLLSDADAPLYAFMDPNQSLRSDVQRAPVDFPVSFKLRVNCRNTKKIAATSGALLGLDVETFESAPTGPPLRTLRARSARQQRGLVQQEIKRLLTLEGVTPEQLVVIGPAARSNGNLSGLQSAEGVDIIDDVTRWRAGEGILVTTARAFKGLEADVVLLYDLGEFSRGFSREDLYVACTRAKILLIAITYGVSCRAALEDAIESSKEIT